jgi:hypothetical protein
MFYFVAAFCGRDFLSEVLDITVTVSLCAGSCFNKKDYFALRGPFYVEEQLTQTANTSFIF